MAERLPYAKGRDNLTVCMCKRLEEIGGELNQAEYEDRTYFRKFKRALDLHIRKLVKSWDIKPFAQNPQPLPFRKPKPMARKGRRQGRG